MPRRLGILALVLLATTSTVARAQDSARRVLRVPPPTSTPFVDVIREATLRLRLDDLHAPPHGVARELRLWHGFGIGGVALLILRQTGSRWEAVGAEHVDYDSMVCVTHLPDTTNWAEVWDAAVRAGLMRLPAYPRRDSSDYVISDGFSAVFEVAEAGRYQIAGAGNPDSYPSADDKLFLRVLAVFRPYIREPLCRWHKP